MHLFPIHIEKLIALSCEIKPNLDCNYTFPIYLTLNGILFGVKLTGKGKLQSKFGFIQQGAAVDFSLLCDFSFLKNELRHLSHTATSYATCRTPPPVTPLVAHCHQLRHLWDKTKLLKIVEIYTKPSKNT